MSDFTYPWTGVTRDLRDDAPPPPGTRLMRVRADVGRGADAWEAAVRALLGWDMHRATRGLRVRTAAPEAVPGAEVVLAAGIGPLRLRAPCRVVWTTRDPDRAGFAYGTLPGHPVRGEESFIVERRSDGRVSLTVTAVSRPAAWYLRGTGVVGRASQRTIAHSYARALGRLCAKGSRRR
ncbi:DUF1990 family protein [Streptomyces avicenniae]|uniref:DUF1990 family protein n=1 Tax=Streptomyces avicenniae TaxID=500153 RepID=UPI00069BD55B|nr:DUF1990 domain-containing protein [Streptomyces avicenniae]